jgi:hypothetical protein
MSANLRLKVLAGAIALALGGTAFANTSTDGTATGDVFLNIVDTNNQTSFFFDTGVSQASFNGSNTYNFNVASDPNYTAFKAGIASGDTVDYSVLSATKIGSPALGTVFFTTNSTPIDQNGSQVSTAQTTISTAFLPNVNSTTSTTTNSAHTTGGGSNYWGLNLNEGVLQTQLGILADSASIGTALSFYSESSSSLRSTSTPATLSQFAGTWNLDSTGALSYSGVVPLPTPLVLLLSGLGLMGVMSRRGKSSSNEFLGNASAV